MSTAWIGTSRWDCPVPGCDWWYEVPTAGLDRLWPRVDEHRAEHESDTP